MEMEIGPKLRGLRQAAKINLEQLAEKTGLSIGLISQIERGLVGPSVASLWKLAQALNVSMGYFFDEGPKEEAIVRRGERKKITMGDSKVSYEMLCPDLQRNMECLMLRLKPHEVNTNEPLKHKGEEWGIIIKGKIKIVLEEKEYILEEGDSIYYYATIPHYFENIGDEESISIWVNTPPSF